MMTFLMVGVIGCPLFGDDKITVKLHKDEKGDKTHVTEKEIEKGQTTMTLNGKPEVHKSDKLLICQFHDEILEKQVGKHFTKAKRTYEKLDVRMFNKKMTTTMLNKPVLIERLKTDYKFTINGKEVAGEDDEILRDEFKEKKTEDDLELEDLLMPKQPLAVNETWKPAMAPILSELADETDMNFDAAKSTAQGKLTKVYKKDGKQYGVLKIDLDLAVTKMGVGGALINMAPGSTSKMTCMLDGCIDGSCNYGVLDIVMDMKIHGSFKNQEGKDVKMDFVLKKTMNKVQGPVGK